MNLYQLCSRSLLLLGILARMEGHSIITSLKLDGGKPVRWDSQLHVHYAETLATLGPFCIQSLQVSQL